MNETFIKQLQTLYNYKSKEEREIVFSIKLFFNKKYLYSFTNQTASKEEDKSKFKSSKNTTRIEEGFSAKNTLKMQNEQLLLLLTSTKTSILLELVNINEDFNSIFDIPIMTISEINKEIIENTLYSDPNQTNEPLINLTLKLQGEKTIVLLFNQEENSNISKLIWCISRLLAYKEKKEISTRILMKNIDMKDINEQSIINKYYKINDMFSQEKDKMQIYTLNSNESEILEKIFNDLNLQSIITYDLESLQSKLENYSIETKEKFIGTIKNNFSKESNLFLNQVSSIEANLNKMKFALMKDASTLYNLTEQIKRIEEDNHKDEMKFMNMESLFKLLKEILNDLSPGNEQNLVDSDFKTKSELEIFTAAMNRFTKFFLNRKQSNINLDIIAECEVRIINIINHIVVNFSKATRLNIKNNKLFKEMNFLRNVPELKSLKINNGIMSSFLNKYNTYVITSKQRKLSLFRFFKERKFFIEFLLLILESNHEITMNSICINECEDHLSKALRDKLIEESNNLLFIWEAFYECDLFDSNKTNVYLDRISVQSSNEFENELYSQNSSEFGKFIAGFFLNVFFSVDTCINTLKYFFESKDSYSSIVTSKLYLNLCHYINNSTEKNILMGFVIYCVLLSIKSNIQKNIINDVVIININDVLDNSYNGKNEESVVNLYNTSNNETKEDTNLVINDISTMNGMNRISVQETKDFIEKNIKDLSGKISIFISEQKANFINYKIDIRYIGIVPIIKKNIKFLDILFSLTGYLKQDYLFELTHDFLKLIKECLDSLVKTKDKYSNIVLAENYYYLYKFFSHLEDMKISHCLLEEISRDTLQSYNYRKELYITENFNHFFPSFMKFYNEFKNQYNTLKESSTLNLMKVQNNYTFDKVDKQVQSFTKGVNSNLHDIAERIYKHFNKENILTNTMWAYTKHYIRSILNTIAEVYSAAYDKQFDETSLDKLIEKINIKEFKIK